MNWGGKNKFAIFVPLDVVFLNVVNTVTLIYTLKIIFVSTVILISITPKLFSLNLPSNPT